jgi:fructuronate reductase
MSTVKPLTRANLAQYNPQLAQPEQRGVQPAEHKIVHLGIGAFSRAHQALFTQIANDTSDTGWSIVGVSLRSPGVRDTLAPQDYLYTVMERSLTEKNLRSIRCLETILVGSESAADVVAELAQPSTKIVTVTVTEKGYCQKAQHLDTANAAVQQDLGSGQPSSMPAFLAYGLQQRQRAGLEGLTIISCDNLPDNGRILRNVVTEFAATLSSELAEWINANVSFCSTMVDRIVPAVTESVIADVTSELGLRDAGALLCEPFKQWVIEDNFLGPRPAWENAGALLVADVAPYEKLKLRMLNGCHSAIAYIGSLLGDDYVHQTIARPEVQRFIERLMADEQSQSLTVPAGIEVAEYSQIIIERFKNKYVPYRNAQVATDGSLKLPQRLLYSACDLLKQQQTPSAIALAIAAWLQYLVGYQQRQAHAVSDPNLATLEAIIAAHHKTPAHLVQAMLRESGVFPQALQDDTQFASLLTQYYDQIEQQGIARVLA